jgi:hypothetical protein
VRAGLSCQQGLQARADPEGPLGRCCRLHRPGHVDQVDQVGPADRLGQRLRPLGPQDRVGRRPLWSLRAFKAAGQRETEHKYDDGDRKTHRDSSSPSALFPPDIPESIRRQCGVARRIDFAIPIGAAPVSERRLRASGVICTVGSARYWDYHWTSQPHNLDSSDDSRRGSSCAYSVQHHRHHHFSAPIGARRPVYPTPPADGFWTMASATDRRHRG